MTTYQPPSDGPLFDTRVEPAPPPPDPFDEWLKDNAEIYDAIVALALKARRQGIERWAIKALIEIVRWDRAINRKAPDFKVNNNHAPTLARLIMDRTPELAGFFEIRYARGDDE